MLTSEGLRGLHLRRTICFVNESGRDGRGFAQEMAWMDLLVRKWDYDWLSTATAY